MINPNYIINYIRENKITKEKFCEIINIDIKTLDNIIYYRAIIEYSIIEKYPN